MGVRCGVRSSQTALIGALLLLGGCASGSGSSSGEEPAAAKDMTQRRAAPSEDRSSTPDQGGGLGDVYRPAQPWSDPSAGEVATLVYVTEMRDRSGSRPGAMIFTSDPASAHFLRKATPRFVVRRLYKREMTWLLKDLSYAGFAELPWQDEPDYEAGVRPERALHYYAGGKRRYLIKDQLDGQAKRSFRRLEDRLIQLTLLR